MNVLVVDDEPLFRELIAEFLKPMGHTIFEADDGDAAFDIFSNESISVVITDLMMPRTDGLELCRRIRQSPRTSYPYLILMTGMGDMESYLKGMDAGADDFVTKPLDLQLLDTRIRVATRIVGLQRQVEYLEALVPICSYCKQIRDVDDSWSAVETYLQRQGTLLSHGICPDCYASIVEPQLKKQME